MTYMIDPDSFKGGRIDLVELLMKCKLNFNTIVFPLHDAYSVLKQQGNIRPLPGGSHFEYFVIHNEDHLFVGIADSVEQQVVGAMQLQKIADRVYHEFHTILLDTYRGQALGLSMCGIVLSVCKFALASGDTQTPDGYRMWLKLATVPGVSIQGITTLQRLHKTTTNKEIIKVYKGHTAYDIYQNPDVRDTIYRRIKKLLHNVNGKFLRQNHSYVLFPVKIENDQFTSEHFKMQKTSDTFMLATYRRISS